eukprot:scaffold44295_cov28-Tisochrysis_lutea.AAC.1
MTPQLSFLKRWCHGACAAASLLSRCRPDAPTDRLMTDAVRQGAFIRYHVSPSIPPQNPRN